MVGVSGCDTYPEGSLTGSHPPPPPPRDLAGSYYAGGVDLTWRVDPRWGREPFRVYRGRAGDATRQLIAEVSSCSQGACSYRDPRVDPGVSYDYDVRAVGIHSGVEAPSEWAVRVHVPHPAPPPVPTGLRAIALDRSVFLSWDPNARAAASFSQVRVWMKGGDGSVVFLGSTDSDGFLDLQVENGTTYGYFLTALGRNGDESAGTPLVLATPRPDYRGEILYAFHQNPAQSGFRFPDRESDIPILPGGDPGRDFRLEVDGAGWWLVPAPGVQVHGTPVATTALRCGPAADAGCVDVPVAPASGYVAADIGLTPGYSYVLRVPGAGGRWHVGVLRVTHIGTSQNGPLMIFDWAFQLQPENPALTGG
jgi:hypothetical protein